MAGRATASAVKIIHPSALRGRAGAWVKIFPKAFMPISRQSFPKPSRNYKAKAVIFFAYFTLIEMGYPAEGVIGLNRNAEIESPQKNAKSAKIAAEESFQRK